MSAPENDLPALRREIDRIDAAMHDLLMERGGIIDRLIASKGGTASGSAFRPEREASMMRALAARHRRPLPLEAVEGIWRIIISTFTYVQAPFSIHADLTAGDAAMRDSARFHFGFTVPYRTQPDAAAVIAAVAASRGDLGLVSPEAASGPWWRLLEPDDARKIIARLPFLDRPDRPASLPVLVVSKVAADLGPDAVTLLSVGRADPAETAPGEVVASEAGSALVAVANAPTGPGAKCVGGYPSRG